MAKDYKVKVNFGGYYGCDETYEIYAENEDDALEQAREIALDDCSFEIVNDDEDEEDESED